MKKGKVVYITAKAPFGSGEGFILAEMLALKENGADLLICPRDSTDAIFHSRAGELVEECMQIPLFSPLVLVKFVHSLIKRPGFMFKIIKRTFFDARNLKIAIKNALVIPKSVYISEVIQNRPVSHIHAHWGSTPSTMAYIISKMTGIPWSFTVHRWDIKEDNLLGLKVSSAEFTRCISKLGRDALLSVIKEEKGDLYVIHMGTDCGSPAPASSGRTRPFVFVTPASYLPVKGHRYLISACSLLRGQGITDFICKMYGAGDLKDELLRMTSVNRLERLVQIQGEIPNNELLDLYKKRKVNAIVLPSVKTENDEHEGIPVSLMEAMAHGIPAISTNTGGIPELLGDGCGIVVRQKEPAALAGAMRKLMDDKEYYDRFSRKGREKVLREFNADIISRRLLKLFDENGCGREDVVMTDKLRWNCDS